MPYSSTEEIFKSAGVAKEKGNAALKSADLPVAIDHYEEAVRLCDEILARERDRWSSEPVSLNNNELVQYGEGKYALIDTAYASFGDYVLRDLGNQQVVKVKAGKYEEIEKRFHRNDLFAISLDYFDLRLAILQNLALVTLKQARATKRESEFQDTIQRADKALAMDGQSAKALMRKGAALIELNEVDKAAAALVAAAQQTKGKDAEVNKLLQVVITAKGKGKAKRKKLMESGDDPMAYGGQPAFQKYEEYAKKTGARNTRDRKEAEKKIDTDSDYSDGMPCGDGHQNTTMIGADDYDSETEILSGRWMPFSGKSGKGEGGVPVDELTLDMTPEQIAAAVRDKVEEFETDEKAEEADTVKRFQENEEMKSEARDPLMEEAEMHYAARSAQRKPPTEKKAEPVPPVQPKPKPNTTSRITPKASEGTMLHFMGRWKVTLRPSFTTMIVVLVMILIFGGSILLSMRRPHHSHAVQMEEEFEL